MAAATRSSALHENGHPAVGKASCSARRPAPMAVTATAGSAFHRAATALSPGTGAVTSQDPSASWPRASGRGTGWNWQAHSIRSASASRSRSHSLPAGAHLMKQRSAPFPTSYVMPPTSLSHTGTIVRPPATAATAAGTGTLSDDGRPLQRAGTPIDSPTRPGWHAAPLSDDRITVGGMADFIGENLANSRFERADLSGSEFVETNLSGSRFRNVDLRRSVLRGLWLADVEIDGLIRNVTINGVDVAPLIEAELNKRDPDRAKMRPADPACFREAWDTVERLWDQTVARARRLPPDLLHESVDGEWSFIETLRHLTFATDVWIRRAVHGDPAPWHPLGLPADELPDTPGVPRDRSARPSLDEVLSLRRDRMSTVRRVIDGLTDASLGDQTTPVHAPGWPPPRSFPVRECLLVILNEEWHHRRFAERD